MMRANENETLTALVFQTVWKRARAFSRSALIISVLVLLGACLWAQDVNIQQAAGGITLGGSKNNRRAGFGTMNGLGIGAPVAGATILPATGGVLYSSPINLAVNGASAANPAVVGVYVGTNFAHPLMLQAYSCTAGCASASNYTAVSLNSASPTWMIPPPGQGSNSTVTVYIAIFVSNQNGAAAFTGTDSVTLTYPTYNGSTMTLMNTDTLRLNNPMENLQTAVQFTLGTATGGLTIAPAADYSANFGNVNGLGIGPGAGLSTLSVAGGVIYSTPYLLNPLFADFTSTTATLTVTVSVNFAHPAILALEDASSSGGPYSAIPTTPATITLTTTAGSSSSTTRYLGLFVSNANGPTAFTGSDSATLTFTMTVP